MTTSSVPDMNVYQNSAQIRRSIEAGSRDDQLFVHSVGVAAVAFLERGRSVASHNLPRLGDATRRAAG